MDETGSAPAAPLAVLHLCSITSRGGTGYMASHICRLLHGRGHRVVMGTRAGGKVEERAREDGIERLDGLRFRPGFHPVDLWRDVQRIRQALRERAIQIVNAWHSIEYWTAALAVRGTGVRLARTRGLVTPQRPHLCNRFLHARTHAVFATCRRIEANYAEAGFGTDNVFLLPDGVDTERFRPGGDRAPVRQELGLADDVILIANVGRLQDVKDQTTFLRALAQLPASVHGVIAGDGPSRESLLQEAAALGLGGRAHLLGVRADIPAILAAADIYTLCSVGSEGSSRATLEAMAAGLPCVTTTVGMLPDIVKPGRTGLLFGPGRVEELVECLENLLADGSLRRHLGKAARAFVEAHHSETVMVRRVEEVYRAILARE